MSAVPASRAVVLTPGIGGADGISAVSRMVVRALSSPGTTALDIVSLNDPPDGGGADPVPGVRFIGASGRKLRWVGAALGTAVRGTRATDVVCLHLHLSGVASIVAAARRSRLSVFLHGIEAWRPLAPRERWTLRHAGLLIANSHHTVRRFREANPGLSTLPVRVCPLGVAEVNSEEGAEERLGPGERGPFALIVSRMAAEERYKGHDLLLDIWPRVIAEAPEARLVVAGDGDDRARLAARAAPLGDRVRFAERVSAGTLRSLYRESAFFVMPSRAEGFGLVFLEAMRAGKACIGGIGAASEVIDDGVTGLVVDPDRPEAVLAAVLRLFREPETRERMGKSGAARVARGFTEADFHRRFRAIFGLGEERVA